MTINPYGWYDTAVTANTADWYNTGYLVYSTDTGSMTISASPPTPAPKKAAGPLAWLDERVSEIANMGREVLGAV